MPSEYNLRNREKLLAYQRAYRAANKDQIREKMTNRMPGYYSKNKTTYNARSQQWRKDNPDKVATHSRFRDRVLRQQMPPWAEREKIAMVYSKRDELNAIHGLGLEVDHIIPLVSDTVCGLHCWANLQLLDQPLNGAKRNTYQTDW